MFDDVISSQLLEFVSEHPDRAAIVGRPVPQHLIGRVGGVLGEKLVVLQQAVTEFPRQIVPIFAWAGRGQHSADASQDGGFESTYRTLQVCRGKKKNLHFVHL